MTKYLLITFVAVISSAAQAKSYTCKGVYDNKGSEVVLKLKPNGYSVYGSAVEGDGFTASVNCSGTHEGIRGKYNVYSTNRNARVCPVDYVKIMASLEYSGSGML